jgi:dipeptidyl-peptidase-3
MKFKHTVFLCGALACAIVVGPAAPAADSQPAPPSSLLTRVDQTGFVRVEAPSFQTLSPKQKALAYWLTQAAIAIDPIVYDQLSAFGLREKRLLEEILRRPEGIAAPVLQRITQYTELFWANRGNHNETTSQKFLPAFNFDELQQAALTAQHNGAMRTAYGDLPPLTTPQQLKAELQALRAAVFDPAFEPMNTAKSPSGGKDIVQASANTFYPGLSLADLQGFHDEHPLNSRVVKDAQGHLHEEVYRAGTPDGRIAPGLYATYLRKANEFLAKAQAYAEPAQAQVIGDLIRYYQTGDPRDWLKFDEDWVQNDAVVDFSNGFVEVYRDARGQKGSAAAFVSITDKALSATMGKLAANAAYFEQKAPWAAQYRKQVFRAPVIKAVEMLIETGDFHVTTVGDNLPNENAIREKFGSKNFLITSSSRALNEFSLGPKIIGEFGPSPETIARDDRYGVEAYSLMVALHEVIGHGSGKLSPKFAGGSEQALKEYYSTLEEGRADLMALWNVWDPKLAELGLISNQTEVAKAMYDIAAVNALRQLRNVKSGDTLEEDHARDRQMIVNYIMATTGGIEQFKQNGKTYIRVSDYQKMRQGVGKLLAELMRIKAEGDYAAIKALVDQYGVRFDPALRDEVVARFNALDMPTYFEGVTPILSCVQSAKDAVPEIPIAYPSSPQDQFFEYAAMYDEGFAGHVAFKATK